MQTFLPSADFDESARLLDQQRLGKQRVEALQILRALTRETYGWKHHPAVRMWAGHEEALCAYALAMCREWKRRGFADTVVDTLREDARLAGIRRIRSHASLAAAGKLPPWLGDPALHLSHRAALVRKDPLQYAEAFSDVVDDAIPYVWPSRTLGDAIGRRPTARRHGEDGRDDHDATDRTDRTTRTDRTELTR